MIDIILINSPIILDKELREKEGGDEVSYYPLNILYLASMLEKNRHSVKVVDISAEHKSLEDVIEIINKENPLAVGISSMTPSIQSALTIAKAIKRDNLKVKVGLGGTHLTVDPDFIYRNCYFDFGVVGEGELVICEIMDKIKKEENVRKIWQGIPIEDLDTIPFPARHLINPEIYKRKEQLKFEVPAAGILGSRGCPFNCIFCCIPARGKQVRFRSAKNIVDEMEEVYDQCQGSYSFVDDCFTISKQRVLEFCREIDRRGLKTKWIASTRADTLDEEMASMLSQAGCVELYFGVESGNTRIRNQIIGKRLLQDKIKEAVTLCRKSNIISNLFLMCGFPTETKKEIEDTIRIGNRVKADNIGIHVTMPFPGSGVYKYALEHKMIEPDMIDKYARGELGKGFRGVYPMFIPEGLTLQDLVEAKKRAYRSFYLNLGWMWRRLWVWIRIKGKFREDLKLFRLIWQVFGKGQTYGQLS